MNWNQLLYNPHEQPLERIVDGYSHTSIFRSIAFVGDSMSSGEFETRDAEGRPGYHDMFEYSWGQHIARKNSLTAHSFSRGGMTAREYIDSFAEDKGFWDPSKAAQAYVIALGANDIYGRHEEIGSAADVDLADWRNNTKNFAGYYGAIVSRYKEISPDAKFFFLTLPNENRPEWNEESLGIRMLYELAEKFDNAYVLDLYRYGPRFDARFREQFFLLGHMTASGYILIAQIVDSYIDYLVRHNPRDFEHVPFINSGIAY
ncbi:MAG: SGNH/GDSL hydrolase family protein [Clostridia bacterium]|nr:SGNH/GDSL hydrolase family protein [Clostridia bacterium]